MVKHCQQSHKRYQHYLAEKKDTVKEAEVEHEIKVIDEEIKNVQNKKSNLEETIKSLLKDADELSFEAEKENCLTLLAKANSFRNSAKEKEKTWLDLDIASINLNKSREELKKKKE